MKTRSQNNTPVTVRSRGKRLLSSGSDLSETPVLTLHDDLSDGDDSSNNKKPLKPLNKSKKVSKTIPKPKAKPTVTKRSKVISSSGSEYSEASSESDVESSEFEEKENIVHTEESEEEVMTNPDRSSTANSTIHETHDSVTDLASEEVPIADEAADPEPAVRQRRRRAPRKPKIDLKAEILLNHPELATVWTELEEETKVIETVMDVQPADVNVKLLPFQLEGLHWLKQQEESRFAGGILADEVFCFVFLISCRWEWVKLFR